MPLSTHNYGIDTSVFVRLLTGHPASDYEKTLSALEHLIESDSQAEIYVSNQVIGEAYITLQHFYKISKLEARKAILKLFAASWLAPLNGAPVLEILQKTSGAGLVDRLIVQDNQNRRLSTLTNDKQMAKIDSAHLLK